VTRLGSRRIVLRLAAILVAALVSAILVLWWTRDALVTWTLRRAISGALGVGVRLDRTELGLSDASWHLQNLVLSNPPGFGPGPMVEIPEIFVRYDTTASRSNAVRLAEFRFHLSGLHVDVDGMGRTNLMVLGQAAMPGRSGTNLMSDGWQFAGIDRLTLSLGRITFRDARDPARNRSFDLAVTNHTLQDVTSVIQLVPLALEIGLRSGWSPLGTPSTR
jgi:hypothetical protein